MKKVAADTRRLLDAQKRLYTGPAPDKKGLHVSFEKPTTAASAPLSYDGNKLLQSVVKGHTDGHWLAEVAIVRDASGQNKLRVTLLNWVVDGESGKMQNKAKYEWFLAELTRACG